MKYRQLGSTGILVSEIGFGGSRIGGIFSGSSDVDSAQRALERALDEGITFYDTADMYAQGESEALIGRTFRKRRDEVIIATKGGYRIPTKRAFVSKLKPLLRPIIRLLKAKRGATAMRASGSLSQEFTPEYITSAVEASLRRLKTDHIDLYQLHSPPPNLIAEGVCAETLQSLKQAGKIRFYGIAADCVNDAEVALAFPGASSIQVPLGFLDPEAMTTFLPRAASQNIGVIVRGCYGAGLLKDTLSDQERQSSGKGRQIQELRDFAQEQNRTVLDSALHFALAGDGVSVALIGMRTVEHVTSNLLHYNARPFSAGELQALRRAATEKKG